MPARHVGWTELNTHNVEKAKTFYAKTIGWSFEEMGGSGGGYWLAKAGDAVVAGLFQLTPDMASLPEHWFTYFEVENADAQVSAILAAGGSVIKPAWDIPGVGRIAIVKDANGAAYGIMTSVPR